MLEQGDSAREVIMRGEQMVLEGVTFVEKIMLVDVRVLEYV